MAKTSVVSFLIQEAMMKSRALVSFVLGKCIKMTILVFIFDLHMFVKLMSVVRLLDKAVQLVLQKYSKSRRVLVNHIKHIQRMVREVCKVRSCSPYILSYYDMLYV